MAFPYSYQQHHIHHNLPPVAVDENIVFEQLPLKLFLTFYFRLCCFSSFNILVMVWVEFRKNVKINFIIITIGGKTYEICEYEYMDSATLSTRPPSVNISMHTTLTCSVIFGYLQCNGCLCILLELNYIFRERVLMNIFEKHK